MLVKRLGNAVILTSQVWRQILLLGEIMRAASASIKLFSFFFFWMVLGAPGFSPLRGFVGLLVHTAEGTWRGWALQVTVTSLRPWRGCKGHLSQSPLWDVKGRRLWLWTQVNFLWDRGRWR